MNHFFSRKNISSHLKNWRYHILSISIIAIATFSFFWPMLTHLSTYSSGGDHMFNAWTLARNHHCLLNQNCPNYSDGNIYFPNKDSMLYSETQFSAGLLTLPLHLLNKNPLFAANTWYITSSFLSGLFMYLLALYLSRGKHSISLLTGLVFEFAPTRITSMDHLQNLSIFYLPLIILMLLMFRDTGKKMYLYIFALASSLLFLASWYQMVFGLVVIVIFLVYLLFTNFDKRKLVLLCAALLVAMAAVAPLAKEYVRFSKTNKASFSISDQVKYSSSVNDYFLPYEGTPLGNVFYKFVKVEKKNAYNPDSFSYAGMSLYLAALFCFIGIFIFKKNKFFKENKLLIFTLTTILVIGVAISLGPFIKIGDRSAFRLGGMNTSIAAPYALVDYLLPQLSFIRAIGRSSIISLFALCCLLALLPRLYGISFSKKTQNMLIILTFLVVSLDLLPIKQLVTTPWDSVPKYKISYNIPEAYRYVAQNKNINNLIILRSQNDYPYAEIPTARVEDVLWAGYHNKNIFNGYSGYEPHQYGLQYADFVNFDSSDIYKLKKLRINYVILDKKLSPDGKLLKKIDAVSKDRIYNDDRYALYKI